jgi:predicted Ser/Thr protein kinase
MTAVSQWDPSDDDPTVVARRDNRAVFRVGSRLINGTYIIEAFLARGGMGEVYRANHVFEGHDYAIKIILPERAADETVAQLFLREARELKRLDHDAIVRYRDIVRDEHGALCLIMEFVDGEPLGTVLRRRRFEPAKVLELLKRIGQGLDAAHDLGIVHRDISPENIILPGGEIGRAKLIDFGIAKSLDPGDKTLIGDDFAGKYSFVSPEQAGLFGGDVDRRSDIYSLGLVLAAAALGSGKKLDMGNTLIGVAQARRSVPDLSGIPESLRPLIARMLQPRPQDRPATMREVLAEAERAAVKAGGQRSATAHSAGARPRRSKLWVAAAGLAAATALGVGGWFAGSRLSVAPIEQVRNDLARATSGYRCAELSRSVTRARIAQVSGFVQSAADLARLRNTVSTLPGVDRLRFDVRVRVWPYCKAVAMLKPLVANGGRGASLALASPGEDRYPGARLALDIRGPSFDSYVYIDYFRADGSVVHLLPRENGPINLRPARNHFILGRTPIAPCLAFAGQPGEQLITMVAARRPLFRGALPESENAGDYLPRLAQALQAAGPIRPAAATLFFTLRPAAAGGGREECR